MPLQIILSPRAKADYFNIIEYLKKEWTLKEVEKFDKKFSALIAVLSLNPLAFNSYKGINIRKAVIDKHSSIFYRLKDDKVELITIWASKRNPKKLRIK